MEYPDKGAVGFTHGSNQNLSSDSENIDNKHGIVSENTQQISSNNSDINSCNKQDTQSAAYNYTQIGSEDSYHKLSAPQTISDNLGLGKDNGGTADIESEGTVQQVTNVTEKYEEYTSVRQQEGEKDQSTEYVSEYVLESNTESVYISEMQGALVSSEPDYSAVVISDDENHPNNFPQKADQQNTTTSNTNEIGEVNWVSEYSTADHVNNENVSHLEQTENDQLHEHFMKNEYEKSVIHGITDNVEEAKNQDEENITNEIPSEILVDGGDVTETTEESTEESVKDSNVDIYSYDVKQEMNSMEVGQSDSVVIQEQVIHNTNEPVEHEHVVGSNEIVENLDLGEVSVAVSENVSVESSVEGYTIAEGMEMTEIQEGEYTIVEGPSSLDISTNQQNDSDNSDGTLVLLQSYENVENERLDTVMEEDSELYLSELRSEAESRQSMGSQSSDKPKRGRKSTHDIPLHVLGHDISKPAESFSNGRSLPKPRLGVKVPYRNLTSQIVSKAEIEKEVMDRARLKQEQAGSRGDIIFARKLTQRLARKIAPSPSPTPGPHKKVLNKKSKDSKAQPEINETETVPEEAQEADTNQSRDNSKIHNDSDLLAILEGEGDEMPVLPKEVSRSQLDDSNLKMLEREIALQQLQDLPNQPPKLGIFRGRQSKLDGKAPVLAPESSLSSKNKQTDKSTAVVEPSTTSQNSSTKTRDTQPVHVLSDKENETIRQSHSKEGLSPKKQPVEIEPQVKVNMVLKTYSRKRKTTESQESLTESSLPKKTMLALESDTKIEKTDSAVPTNVYVTKSSRVIKKKVIWDPDEMPTRSPKSVTKTDISQSPKTTTVKSIKPVEKISNLEKISEKGEKLEKEKLVEKKNNEKVLQKKTVIIPNEKKINILKNDGAKTKSPGVKYKKIRSEVDKLLMDEGAVKMLYELKNNDETVPKKKKDVYSVEKAHKEIMKKANEIKSDLQQNTSNESPKSLRKKDAFTPSPVKPAQITYNTERKMSKDSTRSSVHTPPGSPAYSFSHSQSSMLVRRRSSSSISSSDEVDENYVSKQQRKKAATNSSDSSKPKRVKKNEVDEKSEKSSEAKDPPVKSTSQEIKSSPYKTFSATKLNKHVNIDLNYINENCYCTGQVLEELTMALKTFAKDKDCLVVSITSNSKAFCLGLDYSSLISSKEDIRKQNAIDLAEKVREFLLCLLKFPKVLIAGIQGDCVGLGVTMLPLFDVVISSDVATFSTRYTSLGCVAEAGFLLSPPIFTNHGFAAELLYTTQKLTADDAFRRGLVSRLCWPEKYNETLKNIVSSVSKGSKQSLEATKKQLRSHLVQTAEAAINALPEVLIEHWTSLECQKIFAEIESGN